MSVFKRGSVYWYHFLVAGRHVQESTKTGSKTLAKAAEQRRRRELEEGFNSIADNRRDRIRTLGELASFAEHVKARDTSSRRCHGCGRRRANDYRLRVGTIERKGSAEKPSMKRLAFYCGF